MSLTNNLSQNWSNGMRQVSTLSAAEFVIYCAAFVVVVCLAIWLCCCLCSSRSEHFDARIGTVSRGGKAVYSGRRSEHMGGRSIFGRGSGYSTIASAPSVASRSEHMESTGSLFRASNKCVNGVYTGPGTEPKNYCNANSKAVTLKQARSGLSDYAKTYDNLSDNCKSNWNASGGNDRSLEGGAFKEDRYKYGCNYL
jgi:hypothetical protein